MEEFRYQGIQAVGKWFHPFSYQNLGEFVGYVVLPKLGCSYFLRHRILQHNRGLVNEIRSGESHVLLVYRGFNVLPETLAAAQDAGLTVAMWTWDSLGYAPDMRKLLPLLDVFFTFEYSDVSVVQQDINLPSYYLPLFSVPDWYYPIPGCEKDIDVIFVGSGTRPDRREMLQLVAEHCARKGYRFEVYGDNWIRQYRIDDALFLRLKQPDLFRILTPKRMSHQEINQLYARSKLCLNARLPKQQGLAMRTFECLGAGGCLLTDIPETLLLHFSDDVELATYSSVPSLLDRLDRLMSDPARRSRLGWEGHRVVSAQHLLSHRVASLVSLTEAHRRKC